MATLLLDCAKVVVLDIRCRPMDHQCTAPHAMQGGVMRTHACLCASCLSVSAQAIECST